MVYNTRIYACPGIILGEKKMAYVISPIDSEPTYKSIKEAKQAAIEAAKNGRSYMVAKLIGTTKTNPVFIKYKEPKASEINIDVPLNARCDFDGKIAVGGKLSATGDTVYLCIDCLGGAS
jgi:hypothetical protein